MCDQQALSQRFSQCLQPASLFDPHPSYRDHIQVRRSRISLEADLAHTWLETALIKDKAALVPLCYPLTRGAGEEHGGDYLKSSSVQQILEMPLQVDWRLFGSATFHDRQHAIDELIRPLHKRLANPDIVHLGHAVHQHAIRSGVGVSALAALKNRGTSIVSEDRCMDTARIEKHQILHSSRQLYFFPLDHHPSHTQHHSGGFAFGAPEARRARRGSPQARRVTIE